MNYFDPEVLRGIVRSELQKWGTEVNVGVPAPPETDEPDELGNSWGRTDHVTLGDNTGGKNTFILLRLNKSRTVTVWTQVNAPPVTQATVNGVPNTNVYLWVKCTWGNGSASITRIYRVADRIDVTLTGTFIEVSMYFGDFVGTVLSAASVTSTPMPVADVSVFVTNGARGITYTSPIRRNNNQPDVLAGTAKSGFIFGKNNEALAFHAHLIGATPNTIYFLQFYDANTLAGVTSSALVEEFMMTTTLEGNFKFSGPCSFVQGMGYVLSSTSSTPTPVVDGSQVYVAVEIINL